MDVCTIVARNYLAHARVLATSYTRHHPGNRLKVLVTDAEERSELPQREEPFDVVLPGELGIPTAELHTMAAIYDAVELATALKPFLLRLLLERGTPVVVYLDPDIEVFAPLDQLEPYAREHGLVLIPHLREPIPQDGCKPTQYDIAIAGVYNLGFIAVSTSAARFLDWWAERLRRDCIVAVDEGIFVDQRLLDFLPGYFDHFVLRDPGYDVAYWNLHERDPQWLGDRYVVGESPLRFFHFSGFDPHRPQLLSRHQGSTPRVVLSERPAIARLCRDYARQLLAAGYDDVSSTPYGFDAAADGTRLDRRLRRLYRAAVLAQDAGDPVDVPDPFDRATSFSGWERRWDARAVLSPVERARLYLDAGPDLASPKWWVPPLRRFVLRVLRHANEHQRQIDSAIVEAIELLERRIVAAARPEMQLTSDARGDEPSDDPVPELGYRVGMAPERLEMTPVEMDPPVPGPG